ncbi:MAG: LLM class flavin-dependent oxidoreductase [Candidatus Gastranaerophilales bacterium]|nr:LLM class flavin-dependent oxidoreductase [Candidatus Gastranaerophilales bacterium]
MVKKGFSVQKVVDALNKKYGRNDSGQNLTNKLHRGTLKYREALEIADVIGYKIEWIEK